MVRLLTQFISFAANGALLAVSFLVFTQGEAHAYLDPGTGSMLFQVLVGSILASLFAVKMFWHRIKVFVTATIQRRKPDHLDGNAD
jgi:hypothetical protein